jgi:p-hydroxybenzoic acid efflux pump subunit AaeB
MLDRFYPKTLENRAALRTAIGTVIAILIAFKFHLDTPYWAGMTVVIVANLYTGSIVDKAILRIIGTIAGAWGGYFVAGIVVNSLPLFLFANFLLVAIASYYYIFSRYAYAYLLAGISGFIVVAQLAMQPENTLVVAIWRPIEIGLGVLVSAVTAFSLFPNKIQHSLEKQIHSIFNFLDLQLQLFEEGVINNFAAQELLKNNLELKRSLRKATDMIGFLRREAGIKRERIDQFRAILDLLYALSRTLNYYAISLKDTALSVYEKNALPVVFQALHEDLKTVETLFFNSQTENHIHSVKKIKQWTQNYPVDQPKNYKLNGLFKQISSYFLRMSHVLSGQEKWNPQQHFLSAQTRLSRDLDVIKHSIKVGLSAVLALGFWLLSDWPGGLNGIISSIVISVKKTSFEMKSTSIHRLLGCLLGGGIALGSLYLMAMNLYDFIIILFFSLWMFNYYSFKYPKYAYIGLQASIALIITLAQAGGPPVDLDPPLERLGGVLIGIGASYLVANSLWRNAPLIMLARKLHKLFCLLRYNLKQVLTCDRELIKIHDVTNLFWVCRGLIESMVDLEFSGKKQNLLHSYTTVFDELVIIQATLSHIFSAVDRKEAAKTAGHFAINLVEYEHGIIAVYERMSLNDSPIAIELQNCVHLIESKGPAGVSEAEFMNLLAYLNSLTELLRHESLREIFKTLNTIIRFTVYCPKNEASIEIKR